MLQETVLDDRTDTEMSLSKTETKCLHMNDKFPDSNSDAALQTVLGCVSVQL